MYLSFSQNSSLKKTKVGGNQFENLVYKLVGRYKPQMQPKVYNGKDSSGKRLIKALF